MKTITVSIPEGYEPYTVTSSKTEVIIVCKESKERVIVKGFGFKKPQNESMV